MNNSKEVNIIISQLIEKGEALLNRPIEPTIFTREAVIDEMLNDLANYPHHFVLACVMDRQIKAERAWRIPYMIGESIQDHSFKGLLDLAQADLIDLFRSRSFHRFNDIMASCFYKAVQRIHVLYNDDASQIWRDNPRSATVVRRFLQFEGVGIKIATMATNILARDFKIPMQDRICIDISPDTQVRRVFARLGLISKSAIPEELVFCARELNPMYPGIFDLSAWEIGRQWCRPLNPRCGECLLNENCPKIMD